MAVKKTKNRDASKRDIEEHIVAQSTATEIDSDGSAVQWKATQGEVHSDTKFEDDLGVGQKIAIRSFDFKANPEAFKFYTPSKQELFNAHAKQIENFLVSDGLVRVDGVNPRLIISKDKTGYRIIVGAIPRLGEYFAEKAQTLTEIAHGKQNK